MTTSKSVQKRSFKHEIYGSFVWLYAKMITPLLLLTAVVAFFVLYWAVAIATLDVKTLGILTVVMLFIGVNAVLMLFPQGEGECFKGIEVTKEDVPALWYQVLKISKLSNSPTINRLYIDNEFNASASLSKKKGWFGKREFEVTMGLPLMAALTPNECASVIAHEIGHHHGGDARRYLAIYQASDRAEYIVDMRESDLWIFCLPTSLMFSLYLWGLNRLSYSLSQKCEFDADQFAADIMGADVCGRADVALELFSDDMSELLNEPISEAYRQGKELPENLYHNLPERFSTIVKSDKFNSRLEKALATKTKKYSTHPALKDRLDNIGASYELPTFDPKNAAANQWLGGEYPNIADALQEQWKFEFEQVWGEHFAHQRQMRERARRIFEETEAPLKANPNDQAVWFARATIGDNWLEEEAYGDLLADASKRFPRNGDVQINLALHELSNDNPNGIVRLLQIIEQKHGCVTKPAWERLSGMANSVECWSDKYPKLAKEYENPDFLKLVKELEKPADQLHLAYQHPFDMEADVVAAALPQWQVNAIIDYCDIMEVVERVWLFSYPDSENEEPHYYMLINADFLSDEDEYDPLEGIDSKHIPLFAHLSFSVVNCGSGDIKGPITRRKMPEKVFSVINSTRPIFDRQRDGKRLEKVEAEAAEDMNERFTAEVA